VNLKRVGWLFALGALAMLSETPAYAANPHLRPRFHTDKYGRTVEDVCPAHGPNHWRCYAQRILKPGFQVRPDDTSTSADPNCVSQGSSPGGFTPPAGAMTPTDVNAAYSIPASTGAHGRIVALVELPSVNGLADVNAYRQAFNIPPLAACPTNAAGVPTPNGTACFARVGPDGTVNSVSTTDCPGWAAETGLDMDMVSAACPDCSIVLAEADTTDGLAAMNKVAATQLDPLVVSNSWGGPENGPGQDDDSPFNNPSTLTFVASGDEGYMDEDDGNGTAVGADFPSSSSHVIAVGGTTLLGGNGAYTETVWNDDALQAGSGAGGSGCSGEYASPSYQLTSGFNFGSCAMRAAVDVSAAAEFNPSASGEGGIAVYDADDNGWNPLVGTSAACPLTAAIMARVGLGGKDQHELIYKNAAAFNDVTSGTNDNDGLCSDVMCNAGAGWDGPTGVGSPNGEKLAALADPGSETPVSPADAGAATPEAGVAPDTGLASEPVEGDAGLAAPNTGSQSEPGSSSNGDQPSTSGPGAAPKGCACDVAPGHGSAWGGWLCLGLAALALRRRSARG